MLAATTIPILYHIDSMFRRLLVLWLTWRAIGVVYLPVSMANLLLTEFASKFLVAHKNIIYKLKFIRYHFTLALGVVGYRRPLPKLEKNHGYDLPRYLVIDQKCSVIEWL